MYGTPKASPPAPETLENPIGWKCTGYTHGCFCPACGARDIARAEHLNRLRAAPVDQAALEYARELNRELAKQHALDMANALSELFSAPTRGGRHG